MRRPSSFLLTGLRWELFNYGLNTGKSIHGRHSYAYGVACRIHFNYEKVGFFREKDPGWK